MKHLQEQIDDCTQQLETLDQSKRWWVANSSFGQAGASWVVCKHRTPRAALSVFACSTLPAHSCSFDGKFP